MKILYISDLDGTLLQHNVELSYQTTQTLNALIEKGMLFSVATARTLASVNTILKDVTINMPIVLMNGVCIYDWVNKEYLNVEAFPENSKLLLLDIITKYKIKGFAYVIKDGVLSTYYEDLSSKPLKDFYEERVAKYNKPFQKIDQFNSLQSEPLVYFSLMDTKEQIDPIYEIVKDDKSLNSVVYKDNYSKDVWYLEIYSKNASKYHAVQFLRKYLNIDYVVCFGDNRNDLPLFEASDERYAVGNAVEELKQKADAVIGRNKDEGVARWLKKNVILN